MSGHSTGPAGGTGSDEEVDCAKMVKTTLVYGPDPAVVAVVAVGDEGHLRLGAAPDRAVLVIVRRNRILGSIAPAGVKRLKECLESGVAFSATVKEARGAVIRVTIRPS